MPIRDEYQLTQLITDDPSGRVFVEVEYRGFPIQKWFSPDVPGHSNEIALIKSGNPQPRAVLVRQLGDELVEALQDAGILDENGNVIVQQEPSGDVIYDGPPDPGIGG